MTREDLVGLISGALRRNFTYASERQAAAAADTVLRDLKAAGLRILKVRRGTGPEHSGGEDKMVPLSRPPRPDPTRRSR